MLAPQADGLGAAILGKAVERLLLAPLLAPCRFQSIMHYLPNAGAKPGKTVITCKGQYVPFQGVIGRAAGPSPGDRSELMKRYRAAGFI